MTDTKPLSRRLLLQMIFGAGLVLTHQRSAFADDGNSGEGGGDDDSDDDSGDDDDSEDSGNSSPSASLNSTSSSGQQSLTTTSPINKGRVLNQDEVKAAIASGKAATLPLLLSYLHNKFPGKILDVKLRLKNDAYIYEVKLLTNVILLRTILLDARTLASL